MPRQRRPSTATLKCISEILLLGFSVAAAPSKRRSAKMRFSKDASRQRHLGAAMLLYVHADAFLLQRRSSAALAPRRITRFNKDASRQRHLGATMLLFVQSYAFMFQRRGCAVSAPRCYTKICPFEFFSSFSPYSCSVLIF